MTQYVLQPQGGSVLYGTSNPPSTELGSQVTNFAETDNSRYVDVPDTMSVVGYEKYSGGRKRISFDYLDDSESPSAGGFTEFLATNAGTTIYVKFVPTASSTPNTVYTCQAVPADLTYPMRGVGTGRVSLPVSAATRTFPT